MNLKKHTPVIALLVMSALPVTVDFVSAQGIQNPIVGVWRTVVTPRNCQTGEPFPSLPGLFTLHAGGTMSEYGIGPGSSPALRSPGHGVWREHGRQEYSFTFGYYRYNASGGFIGSQKVTAVLELGARGDAFTTRSAIQIFDANDNLVGTGCATAAGARVE